MERRAALRFHIECKVSYKIVGGDTLGEMGQGKTVNMSSGGILFTTDHALARGARVEVEVEWPIKLNDRIPLKLVVQGKIVRSENTHLALAGLQILGHHFRLAKRLKHDA